MAMDAKNDAAAAPGGIRARLRLTTASAPSMALPAVIDLTDQLVPAPALPPAAACRCGRFTAGAARHCVLTAERCAAWPGAGQVVTFGRAKENNVILDSTRYGPARPQTGAAVVR